MKRLFFLVTLLLLSLTINSSCCCPGELGDVSRKGFSYGWYTEMGNGYREEKKYEEAIDAYNKAIPLLEDDDEALVGLGDTYLEMEEYDKAIEAYQKAIKIKPDNSTTIEKLKKAQQMTQSTHNEQTDEIDVRNESEEFDYN